ncbi:hypothetical protein ACHAWF_017704 [Thalassiosira exigua]
MDTTPRSQNTTPTRARTARRMQPTARRRLARSSRRPMLRIACHPQSQPQPPTPTPTTTMIKAKLFLAASLSAASVGLASAAAEQAVGAPRRAARPLRNGAGPSAREPVPWSSLSYVGGTRRLDGTAENATTVACESAEECEARAEEMGVGTFNAGKFPTKGCFLKGDQAYFSPGSPEDMVLVDLPGVQERLWCEDGTSAAGDAATATEPPTEVPSKPPTTADPTPVLTEAPSEVPTKSPAVADPAITTTEAPSDVPTKAPTTVDPTPVSTLGSTSAPSPDSVVDIATTEPTQVPTDTPPTKEPTDETIAATNETIVSVTSTTSPTSDPSSGPTEEPTATAATSETPCLTEEDCEAKSQELGYTFAVGDYQSKGCFFKNQQAFFSPGTEEEMSAANLTGVRERLWCDGVASDAPTDAPTKASTGNPTNVPTGNPTEGVTEADILDVVPSDQEVATAEPSPSPTKFPTAQPSKSARDASKAVDGGGSSGSSPACLFNSGVLGLCIAAALLW